MKKVLFVVLIIMLLLAMAMPAFAAGQTKADVCHPDDEGNYMLINIADPAVDAHIAHGDAQPGDAIPNMPGYAFDDFCNPVPDADADGVLDAVDNCVDVANPDQSDRYGTTKGDACEDDSNGDGTLDVDEPHICVSIDGVEVIKNGAAQCTSAATNGQGANISIAHGIDAAAYAANYLNNGYGSNNTATATGHGAIAFVNFGDNNTATATGEYAYAYAAYGGNNTATATGVDAYASARNGGNNTATATGYDAYASAGYGDNNTVTGTGVETFATATGSNNTVTATGDYALAQANRDNNTVTATGEDAYAYTTNGNNNTATATGVDAYAFANGDNNTATADGVNARAIAAAPNGCTAEAIGDNVTVTCP